MDFAADSEKRVPTKRMLPLLLKQSVSLKRGATVLVKYSPDAPPATVGRIISIMRNRDSTYIVCSLNDYICFYEGFSITVSDERKELILTLSKGDMNEKPVGKVVRRDRINGDDVISEYITLLPGHPEVPPKGMKEEPLVRFIKCSIKIIKLVCWTIIIPMVVILQIVMFVTTPIRWLLGFLPAWPTVIGGCLIGWICEEQNWTTPFLISIAVVLLRIIREFDLESLEMDDIWGFYDYKDLVSSFWELFRRD